MAGLGDRLQGGPPPPGMSLGDRLQQAFDAARAMQEPSRALYEAKHRRAQEYLGNEPPPPELSWEDFASIGSRALGGAQKMWEMAPAAAGALWNDPLGSINRAGLAGQAATDAIIRGAGEPFTQFGDPNVDPAKQGADLALAAMGGSAAIPAETNALRMGIKAYHGSPHSFDKFDSSKIGTGEGAQAYGHGLYFGEREGVAKEYRKKLTAGRYQTSSGETLTQGDLFQELMKAADQVKQGGSAENRFALHPDHRRSVVNRMVDGVEEYGSVDKYLENSGFTPGFEKLQGAVANRAKELGLKPEKGRMYEVDIAADPEHFLDWDKPIGEQSPQVRRGYAQAVAGGDPIASELLDESPESLRMAGLFPKSSGAQAYNTLARSRQRDVSLKNAPLASPQQQKGWDVLASQALHEAGVPGIKYLDQGSRGYKVQGFFEGKPANDVETYPTKQQAERRAEEFRRSGLEPQVSEGGTSNFVVFDDKLISILRKYGLPISAAGLAALSQLHPEEAEAQPLGDRLQGR